jgi:biofilm PGA synthesis N-glycosyltransferase PgaC
LLVKNYLLIGHSVSIIVPGKNEGKHIYKLAMSMKEQSYTNFEFIVIDDGSDDDTERICKSSAKKRIYRYVFAQ